MVRTRHSRRQRRQRSQAALDPACTDPQDPTGVPTVRRRASAALVLLAFAAVFAALEVDSFTRKSATWDEPIHLTAGYLALAEGDHRVDPSHPPLLRMWAALPLLAMDGVDADTSVIDRTGDEAWLQNASGFATRFLYREHDADRLLYAARFMAMLWGIGLGIVLFCWAREWLGFGPAVFALAFLTIEPNLGAHARLVTTDAGAAFFIFATVYCLWRTCRRPDRWNIAALAVCFSLAFLAKFSAVLLVPIVGVLMAAAVALRMRLDLGTAARICALLAACTLLAIWTAYGFRHAPSDSAGWLLQLQDSPIVQREAPEFGEVVARLDDLRLLPNAFTQGLLMSRASARQTAYLAGEYSDDGWWYYFPAVFVLKTPSPLILLLAVGLVVLAARRRLLGADALFVVVPVTVYMVVAMASGINIGVRHILPVYPFLLLIAALGARTLVAWRRPIGLVALACVMTYWGVRYASVYPHLLTYVTAFAGGPDNGVAYVADSNLDWGQDLKLLRDWMRQRDVDHVNLAYFGTADPEYYGIESTLLPGTPFGRLEMPMLPGYVAVSATHLSGVYLEPQWQLFYSGFHSLVPIDRIGNSIYVFWVDRWPKAHRDSPRADTLLENAAVQASLGDGLFYELDWAEHAVEHYREALEHRPFDVTVMAKLGAALLSAGRTGEAIPVLTRAAAIDPGDGRARYQLALALLADRQPREAVPHAEAAARLRPDDPAALDLLGVALANVGRDAEAARAFERALEIRPSHEDAREHLRRLRDSAASRLQRKT